MYHLKVICACCVNGHRLHHIWENAFESSYTDLTTYIFHINELQIKLYKNLILIYILTCYAQNSVIN